jgi:hypothetical protein
VRSIRNAFGSSVALFISSHLSAVALKDRRRIYAEALEVRARHAECQRAVRDDFSDDEDYFQPLRDDLVANLWRGHRSEELACWLARGLGFWHAAKIASLPQLGVLLVREFEGCRCHRLR